MDVNHSLDENSTENVEECRSDTNKQEALSTAEEDEIVNHLLKTPAIFKSQQRNEPELSVTDKKDIAHKILRENCYSFLLKFGHFLKKEHLDYFKKCKKDDSEISYHINKLIRCLNDDQRKMDIKNRRFTALKLLIEKGEYFSESEMMKRNPLLYEHLVGQYLTESEKKIRDNIDKKSLTYVNMLMEMNDREQQRNLYNAHNEEEEEEDNEDEDDELNEIELKNDCTQEYVSNLQNCTLQKGYRWGEVSNEKCTADEVANKSKQLHETLRHKMHDKVNTCGSTQNVRLMNLQSCHKISMAEKQLLKDEFLTSMYQNFLDGKDLDFDYSAVDYNESYDNMDLCIQDEEEKYFDSEFPETMLSPNKNENQDESEDELDLYMKSLEDSSTTHLLPVEN